MRGAGGKTSSNAIGTYSALKRAQSLYILRLLREIEVHLHGGMDVVSACRTAGISDKTYYGWRKRYGGMGRAKLTEFKALEKENQRLKRFWQSLNWMS